MIARNMIGAVVWNGTYKVALGKLERGQVDEVSGSLGWDRDIDVLDYCKGS